MIIYVFSKAIPSNTTIHYLTGLAHHFGSEVEAFTFNSVCNSVVLTSASDSDFYVKIKLKNIIDFSIKKVEYPT